MAERQNPYGLKVDLVPEEGVVRVLVRKREGDDFSEVETETFKLSDVDNSLAVDVALYGLSKLLQDRSSEVKAGPDKLAAMREVMSQLSAGIWEKERAGGAPTVSPEVEALSQIKGISIPDAQRALRKYSGEQREKILSSPKVVQLAKEIRAKRDAASPSAELDDLLSDVA